MDKKYMKRALNIARKGQGRTSPNPLVGAVIVKDGRIIGEGYHKYYGGNHAEVEAINSATESVEGATMYVTLEPCSHYGNTPPCAMRIVKEKIGKVVVAMLDPNPKVAGRGIEILSDNNIEVEIGLMEKEAKELNEIFLKYITSNLPYIYLKYAMTLDGKIASFTGDSKWITNEKSRQEVHKLRNRVKAIMVGIGTVLADNPTLNTRLKRGKGNDPIRIIIDSSCRIPLSANVLNIESEAGVIVVTTKKADIDKISKLEKNGAEVLIVDEKDGNVDLEKLTKILGARGIDSILIEGGGTLNYSALKAGIVDKVQAYISPKIIGGASALTTVEGPGIEKMMDALKLDNIKRRNLGEDILIEGNLQK